MYYTTSQTIMKKEIFAGIILGLLFFMIVSNGNKIKNLLQSNNNKSPSEEKHQKITLNNKISPTISENSNKKLDQNLIKDVVIEDLTIDAQKYRFINGDILKNNNKPLTSDEKQKVRQLVFFYLSVKEDPLFTSPDFDIVRYSEALDLLISGETKLKEVLGKEKPFFPDSFLKIFPDVTSKQNFFLDNPSDKNADDLIAAYKNSARSYENEARKFVNYLKDNQDKILDTNYVFVNVFFTKKTFFSDIEKIVTNAESLNKEIKNRENCLKNGENCMRFISSLKEPELKNAEKLKFQALPFEIIFPTIPSQEKQNLRGPFIVNSPCWGLDNNLNPVDQAFYILPVKTTSLKNRQGDLTNQVRINLATTKYYRAVGNQAIDEDTKKYGLTQRVPQDETNYYMCPDLEYQSKLLVVNEFLDKFNNQYLFTNIDTAQIPDKFLLFFQKAEEFEKSYLNSKIPNEKDLETLSSAYLFAYKILPDNDKNKKVKNDLLERYLIVDRRLSGFDLILNNSTLFFNFVITLGKKDTSLFKSAKNLYSYFYPIRSMWSLLYFPFSRSFWRTDEKPDYLEKIKFGETETKKKVYISYQEAVELYGKDAVKNWHLKYTELLKNFIK